MNDDQERCQLCHQRHWHQLGVLSMGQWDKSNKALLRQKNLFPIGLCQSCHHTQMMRKYTEEIFSLLYFSNNEAPLLWPDDLDVSPYDEMIDFFSDKITLGAHIMDFGCGAAEILSRLAAIYSDKKLSLTAVDYNKYYTHDQIHYIKADLNKLSLLKNTIKPQSIDIVISSHVLEHVIDPVTYLKNISEFMSDEGILFIEVPSADSQMQKKPEATNLVHGQHIHYYSLNALEVIARRSGLLIAKSRQLQTANIPRTQVILIKGEAQAGEYFIKQDAKEAVLLFFASKKRALDLLASHLLNALSQHDKVGIWGLGCDFCALIDAYPELVTHIQNNTLLLFDSNLAGHHLFDREIYSSEHIQDIKYPVFIAPLYEPTYEKMLNISAKWANVVRVC